MSTDIDKNSMGHKNNIEIVSLQIDQYLKSPMDIKNFIVKAIEPYLTFETIVLWQTSNFSTFDTFAFGQLSTSQLLRLLTLANFQLLNF